MSVRTASLLCFAFWCIAVAGCSRERNQASERDPVLERELGLYLSAIAAVQERYVDVDKVQLDFLISNSLRGVVETIDPHAFILPQGESPTDEPVPEDAPPLEMLGHEEGDILVVKIYRFDSTVRRSMRTLEQAVRTRKSPAGILIDGRDAIGHDYDAALAVGELFMEKGTMMGTIVESQGGKKTPLVTKRAPIWPDSMLVTLIDDETSGPMELLAGALKQHRKAVLVGEPTRGVAVIRSPLKLLPDWTVMLTTGQLLDAEGRTITGNPLTPDIIAQPAPDSRENVDWLYRRGIIALRDLGF
ncbi:MAG TPA: S41 family peptidase [Kiritimatiellia bacterium]|nr:S41 family peptidase [Kiritimatiellia bacterium]